MENVKMKKARRTMFEDLFGTNYENVVTLKGEGVHMENTKLEDENDSEPNEIKLGDVKILNVAYIGRNGRIYLNCECSRCHGNKVFLFEEKIRNFTPEKDCFDCSRRYQENRQV